MPRAAKPRADTAGAPPPTLVPACTVPQSSAWKTTFDKFLRVFIAVDAAVLVLIFLQNQFGVTFLPALGKKLNNPLAALLIALFCLGAVNREFRETWTGRLRAVLLHSPERFYVFGVLFSIEAILQAMWFLFPENFHWNLNAEQGYGTHFSMIQLFLLGVFVLIVAREVTSPEKEKAWPWYLVAGLYFYLALDDGVGIHENFIKWSQDVDPGGVAFHFIHEWLWFYGPFILVAVAFLVRFFFNQFKQDPDVMTVMFVALTFWVSVILLEGLAKNVVDPKGLEYGRLLIGAEEGSEMIGATLFLYGFSRYLRKVRARSAAQQREGQV